jgi:hypothetical protein
MQWQTKETAKAKDRIEVNELDSRPGGKIIFQVADDPLAVAAKGR